MIRIGHYQPERRHHARPEPPLKPWHHCNETCRGCHECYRRTGETVCDHLCGHCDCEDEA